MAGREGEEEAVGKAELAEGREAGWEAR